MEPRDEVLPKKTDCPHQEKRIRFQIVKLEERIAPTKGGIPGWGGYYKPCHGAHGKCFP
jgi:hypothetical protein